MKKSSLVSKIGLAAMFFILVGFGSSCCEQFFGVELPYLGCRNPYGKSTYSYEYDEPWFACSNYSYSSYGSSYPSQRGSSWFSCNQYSY